jgi:hypothetical protein
MGLEAGRHGLEHATAVDTQNLIVDPLAGAAGFLAAGATAVKLPIG